MKTANASIEAVLKLNPVRVQLHCGRHSLMFDPTLEKWLVTAGRKTKQEGDTIEAGSSSIKLIKDEGITGH